MIGRMDRRIVIERNTPGADNTFGEAAASWGTYATVWARKVDVSDGERIASGQVSSSTRARFTVRSSTAMRAMDTKDRIVYDGAYWQVHGIKETLDGRDRFLEITASVESD